MAEFKFDIVKRIGVISSNSRGWSKELNLVSWNGAEPKFDVREWSEDHRKMSRGVTLSTEEARTLLSLLSSEFRGGELL